MPPKRRQFRRPLGDRHYKRLFIVAVEGAKTEPQYFTTLDDRQSVVKVECLKRNKGSASIYVLKGMQRRLKEESLRESDEAWLVVHKDEWTDEQLARLHEWSQGHRNYGFALSNPGFEYWLLLHFEDGNGVTGHRDCHHRLIQYLPGYDKSIDSRKITMGMITDAIQRAKQRDTPPCADWPHTIGTTVYRLVENILGA
jgi:hypothetical protein